ncbi:L-lactate permease [Pueribacillus theae]|uniref:L-lactate permease n=1 Tax=Pueribacillus theae TaxID=2171751 RepID=A0A2U1JKA0_9BACI|nr:L-lactate permease [Pueribacillus theae]PWA05303.1 L-lactate permease [Pueribacillus theae]
MNIGLALLPVIVIFILLFILKQSSVTAGLMSYIIAVAVAFFTPGFSLGVTSLFHATVEGLLLTFIVAYVLLFGIWLFHLMNEAGLIQTIASHISVSTKDPARQALILVIAFSPLVESVSGFGIAVIVIAPILIALGFDRFKAAVLSLVSLTVVPWGALSTGTVIGANLTNLSLHSLGAGTALLSMPIFLYFTIVTVYLVGGCKEIKKKWLEILLVSGALFGATWFFSAYVSVELAGVFASLAALSIEMLFIRFGEKIETEVAASVDKKDSLMKALSPYIVLTGMLFLSRLVPVFENWLNTHAVFEWEAYDFRLPMLYSPGFFLLITCLFAIIFFNIRFQTVKKSFKGTVKQWVPVNLSMLGFVAMAEVMSSSGMTTLLAEAGAEKLGAAFVLLSPIIGGIGGFLTGSNTGSNAMFIKLQVQTANYLGVSPEWLANSQNASSGHMTMASPSRVLLGASVSGIKSEENKILKKMAAIASMALLMILVEMWLIHF